MLRVKETTRTYTDEDGRTHRVDYCLFYDAGGYGLSVWDSRGYGDRVGDVTTRREWAEELFRLMSDNLVTPVALREVLEDLL